MLGQRRGGTGMTTQTVEHELLELEKQYWQALKDKDADTALRLTDESCIVVGAQGVGRINPGFDFEPEVRELMTKTTFARY